MNIIKYIFCAFIAMISLTSCTSAIKAQYFSTLMPLYDFDTNAPTILMSDPGDLASAYYANVALPSFKKRGFSNIYLNGQISNAYARNIIYIKVTKSQGLPSNYKYSFVAQGTCEVVNGTPHCNVDSKNNEAERKAKRYMINNYQVTFDWYDVYKQKRVLYVGGEFNTISNRYTDMDIYKNLISQTVSRIDFRKPTSYFYHVDQVRE